MINLNAKRMNVIETAGNGVVNQETIFTFHQKDGVVSAHYDGGLVVKGFLAGRLVNDQLHFKYAQEHSDGNIEGGESTCVISVQPDGKLQLIESFDWNQGKGKNVFQEIDL